MYREPDTDVNPPIDQQIVRLSRLADNVINILRGSTNSLPQGAVDGLAQLAGSLTRLSRQVAQQEGERTSLLALADIGRVINSSLEPNEVLRIVMDTIVRLTGAERGFLMLKDDGDQMVIRVARNWEQETLDESEFAISRTIVNRVVSEGQALLTTNAQEDPRFNSQDSILAYNLRSILCVPLKVKDQVTGVIYADNRVRTGLFTDTELELLTAFGNQAAVAIDNARLFESVRQTLAEVTELKNLMDNVFASIASGVITADIEDKITLCNQAASQILGRATTDLVGVSLDQTALAPNLSHYVNNVRQNNEAIIGLEMHSSLPERGDVDLRFNLSPLKDAEQHTQGVAIVLEDLTERKRLEAQRRLFERMVSPAVIDQLDPDQLALGGRRAQITTVFADIRGFTSYSERLNPEQLVSILNQYLSTFADAIMAEQGTIDKFMGDSVMAWFNAPIPQQDHTLRAVRAALGIKNGVNKLHDQLKTDALLTFGVGIHFGEAVLGLVGTEKRLEYTAIGDSVNTAKRIQENSKPGQILISDEAFRQVSDKVVVQPVEAVDAKGKSKPLNVFEVVNLKY